METAKTFLKPPYYDDYSAEQGFYKILFKEGTPIQTRELNQLQTMLQEQIARLGSYIFKNGSIVSGCGNRYSNNAPCLELDASYNDITEVEFFKSIKDSHFRNITGTSIIKVLFAEYATKEGEEKARPIVVYNIISGDSPVEGEIFTKFYPDTDLDTTLSIRFLTEESYKASYLHIEEGIIFANRYFLFVPSHRILINAFGQANVSIGFEIDDSIVTANENPNLQDNAYITDLNDYHNPLQIGADRLKFVSSLEIRPLFTDTVFAEIVKVDNFFEFMRIENGVITKQVINPSYNEIERTLARRTFDESGSYTVRPFTVKVNQSRSNDPTKFTIKISPGKAYVLGYEFDSLADRFIDIDKALDTREKINFNLPLYYGSYIRIENLEGFFDVAKCVTINFFNQNKDQVIGTAKCRFLKSEGSGIFRLYIFDVVMKAATSLIKSVEVKNISDGNGKADFVNDLFKVYEPTADKLLFALPEPCINTIESAAFTVQKTEYNVEFNAPIEAGPPNTLYGLITVLSNETIINDPSKFLIFSPTGIINPTQLTYIDETYKQVLITIEYPNTFSGNLLFPVLVKDIQKSGAIETKTIKRENITPGIPFLVDAVPSFVTSVIVTNDADEDMTKYFTRVEQENVYNYSGFYLTYTGTEVLQEINITYSYPTFPAKGYFTKDSFKFDIGDIKLPNKLTYRREQVIDFRPKVENNKFLETYVPEPSSTFECNYSYYLSRIDKLVITSQKDFAIIRGIPALRPSEPPDRPDAMTLYVFTVPAKADVPEAVKVKFIENKRYTMRDIGKLETRIENLEYYTALSLLEKDTASLLIKDQNGLDAFKNGFVVDNFKDFKSLDYTNPDNACSFDIKRGYLRPKFSMVNAPAIFNGGASTAVLSGELIIPPFVSIPFIQQLQATEVINLQPFEVFCYEGELKLIPETDEWVDTVTKPDVNVNLFGENDIWEELGSKAFEAEWGSWETKISKLPKDAPLSGAEKVGFANLSGEVEQRLWNPKVDSSVEPSLIEAYHAWVASGFTAWLPKTTPDGTVHGDPAIFMPFKSQVTTTERNGTQQAFDRSKIISDSIGEAVVDVAVIPYMRARKLKFTGKNLKPNTKLYAFFDGTDVTGFCEVNSIKNNIVTDNDGKVTGIFNLPGGSFSCGERLFRLVDDPLNLQQNINSVCETKYTANGMKETKQETILSSREPVLTTIKLSEKTSKVKFAWGNIELLPTPTPTPTNTRTPTPTPSVTPTLTPSVTPSATNTPTPSPSKVLKNVRLSYFPTTLQNDAVDSADPTALHRINTDVPGIGGTVPLVSMVVIPGSYSIEPASPGKVFVGQPQYYPERPKNYRSPWVSCPKNTVKVSITIPTANTEWGMRLQHKTFFVKTTSHYTRNGVMPATAENEKAGFFQSVHSFVNGVTNVGVYTERFKYSYVDGLFKAYTPNPIPFPTEPVLERNVANLEASYGSPDYDVYSTYLNCNAFPATLPEAKYEQAMQYEFEIPLPEGDDIYIEVLEWSSVRYPPRYDPLAESFFVEEAEYPNGVILTGADLFFKTKSKFATVQVELRESVNGYPHSTECIPFSRKVLSPNEVSISNNSSVPTRFDFDAPVYLKPGEYHLVTIAKDTGYTAYVATIGNYVLGSSTERVTKQPFVGTFFKSANSSTWIPQPETDLKFVLYRCKFNAGETYVADIVDTNEPGEITFETECFNCRTILPPSTKLDDNIFNVVAVNDNYDQTLNTTTELGVSYTIT